MLGALLAKTQQMVVSELYKKVKKISLVYNIQVDIQVIQQPQSDINNCL